MTDNLFNAFVTTDQEDYAPGSTATVTASGFGVGETVEFSVAHVDPGADGVVGTSDDSLVHDLSGTTAPWAVTDGGAGDLDGVANGVIVTSWAVNQDAANQAFVLTATSTAGTSATASFTDTVAAGILLAPTGTSPTGAEYNPVKWSVLDGDTITDTIVHATDAYVVGGTVQVLIKSSEHGNTQVTGVWDLDGADNIFGGAGGADDYSINFTWTAQAPDGGDICDTLVVAYQTGVTGGGTAEFSNAAGGDKQGYGIVNADGSHHDVCIDEHPDWAFYKDVTAVTGPNDTDHCPLQDVVESLGIIQGPSQTVIDHAGQVISYTLTLVNDGNVAIHDVTVSDSLLDISALTHVESGGTGTNGDGVLDAGETWTWTYNYTVTQADIDNNGNPASGGSIHNDAVVHTDDPAITLGTADTSDDLIPNDVHRTTDVAVCYNPDWAFYKDVTAVTEPNDTDHCPPQDVVESLGIIQGPGQTVIDHAGQVISYTLTLVNDGNVTIHNVTVSDSLVDISALTHIESGGTGTNGDGVLDAGETWTWTYNYTVTQADIDNNGNPASGGSIHNDAVVHTDDPAITLGTADTSDDLIPNDVHETTDIAVCYSPSVDIAKYIVCPEDGDLLDANSTVNLLKDSDGKVEYRIVVSNTGNVTLFNAVVTDNGTDLGAPTSGDDDLDGNLDVGETWSYTVLAAWQPDGPHTNTAEVESSNVTFDPPATDPATYVGLNPHITLDKKTNGVDHGLVIAAGSAVTWTYDVTNDGNVNDLTNVLVTDNPALTITAIMVGGFNSGDTNQDGNLDIGETWHFQATGIAQSGQYSNTATVTTTAVEDDCDVSVTPSSTDSSDYTGTFTPGIPGLTAGFWSQHTQNWNGILGDMKNPGNLVPNVLYAQEILPSGATNLVLGDVNGNDVKDAGECTLTTPLNFAVSMVSAKLSTKSDARLNLLQQFVASQLNVDNHDADPGKLTASGDLLTTAVKWLTGKLLFSDGSAAPTTYSADLNGDGLLNGTDLIINKLVFANNLTVSTSSTDWHATVAGDPTKPGYFKIDASNGYFAGDAIYATGEDLKNALEAFNQGSLVTSADGSQVGWNNGGTVSDVHVNDQDGLWKVLVDHNIGVHHSLIA